MKAVVFEAPDIPCKIKDIKDPEVKNKQVLIRIEAAALNRRDYWIKKGIYKASTYPCIVGSDGSGIVEYTGKEVDPSLLNQHVIINPGLKWGINPLFHHKDFNILGLPTQGTLSEYLSIDAANVYPKPDGWSFEKSSALPLAGLTAFRALFSRGKLLPGENILITGAGGGVSTFLMKFALTTDANVYITSSSEKKIKKAITLGVHGGVNYKSVGWEKELLSMSKSGFDLIVDSAAGDSFSLLPGLLKIGGRIVIFGGTAGPITNFTAAKLFWKQASILGTTMGSPKDFEDMLDFVKKHNIKPEIDKIFPMEDTELAFKHMENQEYFGKIVIKI